MWNKEKIKIYSSLTRNSKVWVEHFCKYEVVNTSRYQYCQIIMSHRIAAVQAVARRTEWPVWARPYRVTPLYHRYISRLLNNIDFIARQMAGPGARDRRLRPSRALHRLALFTPDWDLSSQNIPCTRMDYSIYIKFPQFLFRGFPKRGKHLRDGFDVPL